jgi:hypothetical protein
MIRQPGDSMKKHDKYAYLARDTGIFLSNDRFM